MLADNHRVAIFCGITLQMARLLGAQLPPQLRICTAFVESWLNAVSMYIKPLPKPDSGCSQHARFVDIICHLVGRIRLRHKSDGAHENFLLLCDEAAEIVKGSDWCPMASYWTLAAQAYGYGISGQHERAKAMFQAVIAIAEKESAASMFFP